MALMMKARGIAGDGPSFRLPQRDAVIGRSPQADWVLPDPTQQLSANHAIVQLGGDGHYLVDTSTNGTTVNGTRLTGRHRLRAGDVVRIGGYEIVIEETDTVRPSGMDLNSWSAAKPATATPKPATTASVTPPSTLPSSSSTAPALEEALARGLATLMATRTRQRRELGVRSADPLATHPLAREPDQAARALAASPAPVDAVQVAVTAIETHHATILQAVQEAFRTVHAHFAPEAIVQNAGSLPSGDARDAALWRAHVAAFEGAKQPSFVDQFADAFRRAYEERSGRS